jgi:hypothetical protein
VKTANQTETHKPKFKWDWVDLKSFSRAISKIRGKVPSGQNFERGEAVELSLVGCSDGALHRVDQVGFDLVNNFGGTLEAKVARIEFSKRNPKQFNQSSFIIKNWQGKRSDYCESMKADLYLVVSYKDMRACFVYPEELEINCDNNKASVTAFFYANPDRVVELDLDKSVEGSYWKDLEDAKKRLLFK